MIAGSSTPPLYLGFFCDELKVYRWAYIGFMWFISIVASILTFFPDRTNQIFRAIVFFLAGASILPGVIHLRYFTDPDLLPDFDA
jgi:predicted membrane channel-forming protein YqfA (hemolysin III family)